MKEVLLLKLGEVVLKGLNRRRFESRLLANLRRRVSKVGKCSVYIMQSTIYVEPADGVDMDEVLDAVHNVFGVAAICRAAVCEKDMDAIWNTVNEYLGDELESVQRFKVEAKRSDKKFPLNTIQICQKIGGDLDDKYENLIPDMHNPELRVNIEVRDKAAYVHAGKMPGPGGMPVGTNGKAALLLSGGIDSPVSSYMIAKRGVRLVPVHFFSFPYTSELAKEKVLSLAKELTAYTGRMTLQIVPFTHIQEEIRRACPEEYFTLIMRRFMMRIAEDIAAHNECKAIVTGENLGQVASQTMEAMACTQDVTHLPVLQPLIGMDKRDIVKIAREIGTFDTSILPYEDCCTVFTPRHPKTRPTVAEVAEAESALDIDALVHEAVDGIERIRIDL